MTDDVESRDSRDLVAVGRVARAQGRHGEIAVDPLTEFPERLDRLEKFLLKSESGELVPFPLESLRMHKGRPVLKLAGVEGIGDAQALRGKLLWIRESEILPLPEGSFYHFEVRGLSVADRRAGDIGIVENVLETGGTDVLVVRRPDGGETLVPLCSEIVRDIDRSKGRIEIDAPEGLVSLNAN